MREAVGLALVRFLRGPDGVFQHVRSAARAGHDVVEAAFVRVQQHAGILAAVAVALADVLRAELRAFLPHARIVYGFDDGRHANRAAATGDAAPRDGKWERTFNRIRKNGQRFTTTQNSRPAWAVTLNFMALVLIIFASAAMARHTRPSPLPG